MNIYDLAGNEFEWTLEKSSYTSYYCSYRGGRYNGIGSGFPAAERYYSTKSSTNDTFAFRSTIY